LVGKITAASGEQSRTIEQIKKAFIEMNQVVQKTAASAEESASASEEMSAQALQMRESVEEVILLIGSRKRNEIAESHEMGVEGQ
jgi:methyl-accepting chemotaxis protein